MSGAGPGRRRLDQLLVERGLAESREKAQRMIRAGQVRRGTERLDKPGLMLSPDTELDCEALHDRFVSRGGWKLEAAFEAFAGLTPCPPLCLDIGASTGGFTDCLLQHGAERVWAVDVGRGQLARSLREDPRVVCMEKTNARHLRPGDLPGPVGLFVTDVSFISLRHILGPAAALLEPDGQGLALVKPQFEAGPRDVGKGGVVRDAAVHRRVLEQVLLEYAPAAGLRPRGLAASPLPGPAGNREYLLWMGRGEVTRDTPGRAEIDKLVGETLGD